MYPSDYINSSAAAVIKSLFDGTAGAWLNELPAKITLFWNTNGTVADGLFFAQTVSALFSALFVFLITVSFLKRRALQTQTAQPTADVASEPVATENKSGALKSRWSEISGHLESTREGDWKLAVIEADKLVESALASAGYSGDTFGDRLMNIQPGTLISLDGLWWAHKVRNRLAHEMDYFLRYTEARQAMAYYEQTLSELKQI